MADNNEESVFSDREFTQQTQSETRTEVKKNPKGRLILVIVGAVFFAIVAFAAIGLMGKGKKSSDGGAVPPPAAVENIPGAGSAEHDKLVREQNEKKAQEQGTSLPELTGPEGDQASDPFPIDPAPVAPPVTTPEVVTPPAPVVDPQPVAQPQPQPEVYVPPAPQPAPGPQYSPEQYASMQSALQAYLEAWKVVPVPAQEFSFNGQRPQVNNDVAQGGQVAPMAAVENGNISASSASTGGRTGPSFVRAGTVIPALLLSSVNSDNPGPVIAQITSGPLAGTRLLGQFQNTGKALVLTFNTMSKPGVGTFSVNVVAVDENYAVGMKTDVNNHYLRRYGLLLAASFLQGYGEAMGRTNTTVVTGPFGSTVSQGELSRDQARDVALGQVGETISQDLLTKSDVEPTVKLDCAGGCPVGLLFMSDL